MSQSIPELMRSALVFGANSGHSGEDRFTAIHVLDCGLSEEEVDVFRVRERIDKTGR